MKFFNTDKKLKIIIAVNMEDIKKDRNSDLLEFIESIKNIGFNFENLDNIGFFVSKVPKFDAYSMMRTSISKEEIDEDIIKTLDSLLKNTNDTNAKSILTKLRDTIKSTPYFYIPNDTSDTEKSGLCETKLLEDFLDKETVNKTNLFANPYNLLSSKTKQEIIKICNVDYFNL